MCCNVSLIRTRHALHVRCIYPLAHIRHQFTAKHEANQQNITLYRRANVIAVGPLDRYRYSIHMDIKYPYPYPPKLDHLIHIQIDGE